MDQYPLYCSQWGCANLLYQNLAVRHNYLLVTMLRGGAGVHQPGGTDP